MKDVELRLVSELLKDSHRSDRELAKALGVSQPTVTRMRARLEKEGVISEYTIISARANIHFSGKDILGIYNGFSAHGKRKTKRGFSKARAQNKKQQNTTSNRTRLNKLPQSNLNNMRPITKRLTLNTPINPNNQILIDSNKQPQLHTIQYTQRSLSN